MWLLLNFQRFNSDFLILMSFFFTFHFLHFKAVLPYRTLTSNIFLLLWVYFKLLKNFLHFLHIYLDFEHNNHPYKSYQFLNFIIFILWYPYIYYSYFINIYFFTSSLSLFAYEILKMKKENYRRWSTTFVSQFEFSRRKRTKSARYKWLASGVNLHWTKWGAMGHSSPKLIASQRLTVSLHPPTTPSLYSLLSLFSVHPPLARPLATLVLFLSYPPHMSFLLLLSHVPCPSYLYRPS